MLLCLYSTSKQYFSKMSYLHVIKKIKKKMRLMKYTYSFHTSVLAFIHEWSQEQEVAHNPLLPLRQLLVSLARLRPPQPAKMGPLAFIPCPELLGVLS